MVLLVHRFRGSNHIDIINQPRPEEPCAARRLEGRPQARSCRRPSFETPCFTRLLRMRSVGLNSIPPDPIGFMESVHKLSLRAHGSGHVSSTQVSLVPPPWLELTT